MSTRSTGAPNRFMNLKHIFASRRLTSRCQPKARFEPAAQPPSSWMAQGIARLGPATRHRKAWTCDAITRNAMMRNMFAAWSLALEANTSWSSVFSVHATHRLPISFSLSPSLFTFFCVVNVLFPSSSSSSVSSSCYGCCSCSCYCSCPCPRHCPCQRHPRYKRGINAV